jgi:hypothetical protein
MSISKPMHHPDDTPQETPSPLYAALEAIGFVGCIDDDENLSVDYKSRLQLCANSEELEIVKRPQRNTQQRRPG